MKYLVIFSAFIFVLSTSCSSAPEGFCECLAIGEQLDAVTQEVLPGGASEETINKMLELRKEKEKVCEKFAATAGPQMLEWQKECKD